MKKIYQRIVFLTGAGISAESGIATFRSSDGLWNNHKVEDVATIEAYYKNQDFVHDFYNQRCGAICFERRQIVLVPTRGCCKWEFFTISSGFKMEYNQHIVVKIHFAIVSCGSV